MVSGAVGVRGKVRVWQGSIKGKKRRVRLGDRDAVVGPYFQPNDKTKSKRIEREREMQPLPAPLSTWPPLRNSTVLFLYQQKN